MPHFLLPQYPHLAKQLLEPLLQLLLAARTTCGGDIDRFLILLVLGLRAAEHPGFSKGSHHQLLAFGGAALPGPGTNARSISDSLGIPSETVRRKLADLMEAGWVMRDGTRLHLTGRGYRELEPVRDILLQLAEHYCAVVSGAARACGAKDA